MAHRRTPECRRPTRCTDRGRATSRRGDGPRAADRRCRCKRQVQRELRPTTGHRVDRQLEVEGVGDPAYERQSEAESTDGPGGRAVPLLESREGARLHACGEAGAGITDTDAHPRAAAVGSPDERRDQRHRRAGRGVLDRVVDQLVEGFADPRRVDAYDRQRGGEAAAQVLPSLRRPLAPAVEPFVDKRVDRDRSGSRYDATGLERGDVDEEVDHA